MSKEYSDPRDEIATRLVSLFTFDKFLSLAIIVGIGILSLNILPLTAKLLSPAINLQASISGSLFQPLQLAGVVLVSVAAVSKLACGWKTLKRNDAEAESAYFNSYSGLTAPERQIRFASLYGGHPPADAIDALITHPTDPLGMVRMYSVSGKHLKREGPWFAISSEWHATKSWIGIFTCLLSGMVTLSSLTAGLWMTLSSQPPFSDLISGPTALLEGLVLAWGTSALIQDLRAYAHAYRVVAAKPPSSA